MELTVSIHTHFQDLDFTRGVIFKEERNLVFNKFLVLLVSFQLHLQQHYISLLPKDYHLKKPTTVDQLQTLLATIIFDFCFHHCSAYHSMSIRDKVQLYPLGLII